MKIKEIKCDYCKKPVPKQTDKMPTWFGRYQGTLLLKAICIDCLQKNRENWMKGGKP